MNQCQQLLVGAEMGQGHFHLASFYKRLWSFVSGNTAILRTDKDWKLA